MVRSKGAEDASNDRGRAPGKAWEQRRAHQDSRRTCRKERREALDWPGEPPLGERERPGKEREDDFHVGVR